ncbi:callose synthase 12-like [Senna tora]|uniref:1,3-beta-glucan synthase n=1 Tax=Senna tora TaxID=362788 RepID=A0A834SNI5_9FABA|nr:callose synthase 12-like [Senna tora]
MNLPQPPDQVYNIIPLHHLPSLPFPELRAAAAALRAAAANLPKPPFTKWLPNMDLLDWLALFFGFQDDNVRNQREHLVLHLANSHMRLNPPPANTLTLDDTVLRKFRTKLLHNYTTWCSYLGNKSNVWIFDHPRELLYVSLYLLIWGEAANLRFLPECLCYIFHHMAMELNMILEGYIDEGTGQPMMPSISGENAFLNHVVKPIYETIRCEVESSKNGTVPHSAWRNYDDINEFFWSKRCFEKLKWPIDLESKFLVTSSRVKHMGKTGFVELRSFWNLFRSFDRLWVMLILFLQAAIIVAWEEKTYPWEALENQDVQVRVLSIFFTWSGLRFLQSLLDAGMVYRLDPREALALGVITFLKCMAAAAWVVAFGIFYCKIWSQRKQDEKWSAEANRHVVWYSLYSSFVGATLGLFERLGEIRNVRHLQLRFQCFAATILLNLMPQEQKPKEQFLNPRKTWKSKFKDAIHRLKLRFGLDQPNIKLESESNKVEANKFALIWNEIIMCFREEDIISDRELELLEIPPTPSSWNVRVLRWPCFLLNNELLLALRHVKELVDATDSQLWDKICKNEFRRCAVIETYDCIKCLLLEIIKPNTEEHSIVTAMFQEIDDSLQNEKFTKTFKMAVLPQLHNKLITLVVLLLKPYKYNSYQLVNILQALYEIAVREFFKKKRTIVQLIQDGLAPQNPSSFLEGLLFENAIEFPDVENVNLYRQLRRLHTILTSKDSVHNVPANLEARRRIAFFSNSIFMNMPQAPPVEKMMAFSVLTPYYNEEVLFTKEHLRAANEDGISILYYLQTIFDDEWKNFIERMYREGLMDNDCMWGVKHEDLRLWASYRGQTLSRTVRGMMYYSRALHMLSFLDSASSEMDIPECSRGATSSVSMLFKGHERRTALMKFTYVIACQIYGTLKQKKDHRADEILYLMKNNEALRVAYVDEVSTRWDEKEYYSVLVKYDQQLKREVEIYRIRLPGPFKLGEGKPENQNHAIIFTRGDALQTIDMNQDNYFEEALKMRNLLEEYNKYYGIRKPTILGMREHIFTGSVSSLAGFMSAQDMSFVTLGQRVLANPLKVRMHYGHPDVFDRFWFITRGGISKASRVINISEDIFAGFNCTLRGGNVTHHEYIQVGKGRDVGLNQISMFEAKIASGNGEQVLSRDVFRLGQRLDFFRMLSFFYSSVGFFFNTTVVVVNVYAYLWCILYLALSGIEAATSDDSNKPLSANKALGTILTQEFIINLGFFTALPMFLESYVEPGFVQAIWDFLLMQFQLSSVFYTFSMGTRSHFFGWTILHGGAKYRATGRGFVVQRKSFAENYRLYARSHFLKAIEFALILITYASFSPTATDTYVYILMTVEGWFLVVSWIMAPFLFNPSGFDWLKTVGDFDDFMKWIWFRGSVLGKGEESWERWWYEEQDHLRATGLWGKVLAIVLDLRFFFFQYGIVYQQGMAHGSTSITVYFLSWIYVFAIFVIYAVVSCAHEKCAAKLHIYYRVVLLMVISVVTIVITALVKFTALKFVDILTGILAFVPTGWGVILIAQVFQPYLKHTMIWEGVVSVARLYDILFGMIVMAPMALLSWLPGIQFMQTRILFNEAFSRGLHISQILTSKNIRSFNRY